MGYIGAGPTRFNTADELTVTGNAEFNGNLTVKGTTTTIDSVTVQNFDMGDNDRIRIGDSQDLQIYHDGSNSIIAEASTGSLKIQGSDLYLTDDDGTNMLYAANNGGVTLYNGGGAKLATTATGVDVTGTVTADGLTVDGTSRFNDYIHFGGIISTPSTSAAIYRPADNQLAFSTANSEAMRIDSSGNVGIGTSSPTSALDVRETATSVVPLRLETNAGAANTVRPQISMFTQGSNGYHISTIRSNISNDPYGLAFVENTTERMRIDSDKLRIGTGANDPSSSVTGVRICGTSGENFWISSATTTGSYNQFAFLNPNGYVGFIQTSGSSTSYVTSSDYRLKENVTAEWDATTRLKQLNPVRFNFIADADTTVDGFLAHEVQDVVPEAITGTKDAMRDEEYEVTPAVEATYDDDGNILTEAVPAVMGTRSVPEYQGIDQSKLVPLLVKTIQELEARITALETA